MSCQNNLKQISLAYHNYHAAYNSLPMQMGGTKYGYRYKTTTDSDGVLTSNVLRLSSNVAILPFMEQQSLWEQISNELPGPTSGPPAWPPMGPSPWVKTYTPWTVQVPTFLCPSDPESKLSPFAMLNYGTCHGDASDTVNTGGLDEKGAIAYFFGIPRDIWAERAAATARGVFQSRHHTSFKDIIDGTANTIMLGEFIHTAGNREVKAEITQIVGRFNGAAASSPKLIEMEVRDPFRNRYVNLANTTDNGGEARGARCFDGKLNHNGFQTIFPPNGLNAVRSNLGGDDSIGNVPDGIFSAGSRHRGGCHVATADGAVRFVTESIERGDRS